MADEPGAATRTVVAMLEYRQASPFKLTGTIDKLTFKLASDPARTEQRESTNL